MSADGSTAWQLAGQTAVESPQDFNSWHSFIPLPYFRLRHAATGIVSNIYNFEI
jgi:hypothetical protein